MRLTTARCVLPARWTAHIFSVRQVTPQSWHVLRHGTTLSASATARAASASAVAARGERLGGVGSAAPRRNEVVMPMAGVDTEADHDEATVESRTKRRG